MSQRDWFILMVMGGFFLLLGIVVIIRGRSEEKSYYESLSTRTDVREYLEHWPWRPSLGALKIGGRIAITLGALMLIGGGILWLLGRVY